MGSQYIQKIFSQKFLRFEKTDNPLIDKIYNETNIYRSGKNELLKLEAKRRSKSRAESKEGEAELLFNPIFTNIPQFFGAPHVASLYCKPNDDTIYVYSFNKPKLPQLNLLNLDLKENPEVKLTFLKTLWNETSKEPNDWKVAKEFFFLLGHIPEEHRNQKNYREMKMWALNKIKRNESIKLHEDYPDMSENFNRISISSLDRNVFNKLFRHKFKDEKITNFFKNISGLYLPAMNCGFINTNNFLTLFSTFHEELFIKEATAKTILQFVNVSEFKYPILEDTPELFYTTKLIHEYLVGADKPNTEEEVHPFEKNYTNFCKYISNYQFIFYETMNIINNFPNNVLEKMIKTIVTINDITIAERDGIQQLISLFNEDGIIENLQVNILKLIDSMFMINNQHFINLPETDPFIDNTGSLKEDLLLFTVFSDILKSGIAIFEDILDKFGLSMFQPICGGGILFSMYSFGKFRRLTKDIDIKINQIPGNYTDYENEKLHTQLLCIIYLWESVLLNVFNYIATGRIRAFLDLLPPVYIDTKKQRENNYTFHLGAAPTFEKNKESLIDTWFQKNFTYDQYKPGLFIHHFNNFLLLQSEKMIVNNESEKNENSMIVNSELEKNGLLLYRSKINNLLKEKREIKQGIQEPRDIPIPESDKLTKQELKKRKIDASIKQINLEKKTMDSILDEYFYTWAIKFFKEYDNKSLAFNITKRIHNLYAQNYMRAFIEDEDYATKMTIGSISSIEIQTNGDNNRKYGLIDFTFDTPYSLESSFQKPSNLNLNGTIRARGILCASYLDFIRDTIKLKEICDSEYLFDDKINDSDFNPYNKCAPNPIKRQQKIAKYRERYNLVFELAKTILNINNEKLIEYLKVAENLEAILYILEAFLKATNLSERQLSIDLHNNAIQIQANEPLIGGGILIRKFKRRQKKKSQK